MPAMRPIVRSNDEFPDELPKQHEIVRGILVRKGMPTFEHGYLQGQLRVLLSPSDVIRGGRWWFASECEIELASGERYLPDLAGWDRERVVERPAGARVRIAPQWVCEILSPSTARRDLTEKQATYHASRVDHYWLIDPEARKLTVLTWAEDGYHEALSAGAHERVHAPPFDAIELDLGQLFG